jgi:asparagine synthase (glutamine-hydrolysing)
MCGIIGGWLPQPVHSLSPAFNTGLAQLTHRGPNDQGLERFQSEAGQVVLGHTRLSIIDLSAGGHQPMTSRDGRYALIFNGEIYNYKELRHELQTLGYQFVTDSDTEVLLTSWITWGQQCLARLRGMFAFVVYDKLARKLVCVRDAFGIKPLFYQWGSNGFLFASEVPALLVLLPQRPGLNLQRAYDYLVGGSYDDCADTFFDGVEQLLPGHVLTLDLQQQIAPTLVRWWWPSVDERTDLSFADAAAQLRTMFLDGIRLHLRSDVPLGAALSGGVDSSAVVCAMRHVAPDMPIHTFSYVARGSYVDEENWADLVNAYVGAIAHKVVVKPEELATDLDDLIQAQGEPFGSTGIYAQYRVFKLANEHGVTVTLDGQGADEMLAGYSGYPGPRMRSMLEKGEVLDLVRFINKWSQWPGRSIRLGVRECVAQFLPQQLRNTAYKLMGNKPGPVWLNIPALEAAGVVRDLPDAIQLENSPAGRRLMATLRQILAGQGLNALLRHGDRNSMRWSVESRVPFLSTDLAEFLLSLPERYLISAQGETKHIFRAAMRGIVPDAILDRKDKVGFATPEKAWLKQLEGQVMTWLQAAESMPFLNGFECRHEVQAMIDGKKPFSFQAWRLINFCRWVQIFESRVCK